MMYKLLFHRAYTNDKGGYSLLLAVLIVSTVLSAASAIATVIITEIRQTRATTGSIVAYARADENTERGLYLIRKSDAAMADMIARGGLPDGTVLEAYTATQFVSIPESDFAAFPVATEGGSGGISAEIAPWTPDPNCTEPSWIEVATVSWDSSGAGSSAFVVNRYTYPLDTSETRIASFPTCGSCTPVEMRVRALFCDINQLSVDGIPGRVRLVATGEESGVQQSIETLITRRAPVGGLFDFVIFSACEIIKGVDTAPRCPSSQ